MMADKKIKDSRELEFAILCLNMKSCIRRAGNIL